MSDSDQDLFTSSESLSIDSCDSDATFDFEDGTLSHSNSLDGMQEYYDAATSSDSHSIISSSSSESELNDLSGEEIP